MSPTTHAHPDMCQQQSQQQPSIKMLCVAERFLGRQQRQRNHKKKKKRRRGKQREGVILLQTAGLRHFPVKILNGTGRQTQPYKTISTTIWLRGDVLVVSLKTLHSLSSPLSSPPLPHRLSRFGAFEVCWWL